MKKLKIPKYIALIYNLFKSKICRHDYSNRKYTCYRPGYNDYYQVCSKCGDYGHFVMFTECDHISNGASYIKITKYDLWANELYSVEKCSACGLAKEGTLKVIIKSNEKIKEEYLEKLWYLM